MLRIGTSFLNIQEDSENEPFGQPAWLSINEKQRNKTSEEHTYVELFKNQSPLYLLGNNRFLNAIGLWRLQIAFAKRSRITWITIYCRKWRIPVSDHAHRSH